jgi:hypothetical protein
MFQEKVSGEALLGIGERKAMTFAMDDYEMGFYSDGMEFVIEFLTLSDGHEGVGVAMEDKARRGIPVDMIDRAALDGRGAVAIDRAAEEIGKVPVRGILIGEAGEIGGGIEEADGFDGGVTGFQSDESGEMAAGGGAAEEDMPGVETVRGAVFLKPVKGVAAVVDGCGVLRGAAKAILDGGYGEALAGEVSQKEQPGFVAEFPAAAVDPDNERMRGGRGGEIEVEVQISGGP